MRSLRSMLRPPNDSGNCGIRCWKQSRKNGLFGRDLAILPSHSADNLADQICRHKENAMRTTLALGFLLTSMIVLSAWLVKAADDKHQAGKLAAAKCPVSLAAVDANVWV